MRLPLLAGSELVKLLTKEWGYQVRGQRGSHVHLVHGNRRPLTVPLHATLDRGTLRAILRDAGIGREEFLQAFER